MLLAGVLALPAKLGGHTRLRVATDTTPPPITAHRSAPSAAPSPAELPVDRPIQYTPDGTGTAGPPPDDTVRTPLPPRTDVPHGVVTPESSTVHGVVVGINDYPGTANDLRGAVADAEDMSNALAMYGVPDANVATLEDGLATAKNVVDALQWLVQTTDANSTAVFFYAGHVRKLSDQTEAIVTSDGAVVPDWYLAQQLAGLPAHDVWIVMATCYGGGFTELLAPGRVLTAAADADNLAYENSAFGRSYLDEYLVHQGLLEGRAAAPTAQAAYAYAQAGLERDYPNRTLTQFDESTEPISLDGVHRPADGSTTAPSAPPPPPSGPLGLPTSPPSTPPPDPQPCTNLLGLFCPPGSR